MRTTIPSHQHRPGTPVDRRYAPQCDGKSDVDGPGRVRALERGQGLYALQPRFNDTGAESYEQWYDASNAVVPVPDFSESLAGQADPQEMIDAMVEVIPASEHLYRTMRPVETIEAAKQWQATEWTQNA